MPDFDGEYDVVIATDVFEHVPDPLALVYETAKHLRFNGHYLMANCFQPVILCHLPSTFHFRCSWTAAMTAMGFTVGGLVGYGYPYQKTRPLLLQRSREIEASSKRWFPILEMLPRMLRSRLERYLFPE